jgi:general stress protein 26
MADRQATQTDITPTEAKARAWDMMEELDFAMYTTRKGETLCSRPMSTIVKSEEGRIYILTNSTGDAVAETRAEPKVLLSYGNGSNKFVSAQAKAEVSDDKTLIKQLWNPGAQVFWPEGPDKSDVSAIVLTPMAAEFWDGPNSIVSTAKFFFGLATGTTPDMGENATVRL